MGLRYKNPKIERLEQSMNDMLRHSLTQEELFSFASFDAAAVERTGYSNYSYWRSTFKVFSKNRAAMILVILVASILLFTFLQPILPNQREAFTVYNDPLTGLFYKNIPPGEVTEAGDSFILGTNQIGQDLWAQLWAATRTSLLISTTVALIEAVVGILMGVLWGYVRKLDFLFTEIYNVLDNIPVTIILILVAYILRPGISTMIIAMSLTSWIGMARFVRNQILVIRDREYNLASRCLGTGILRIITKNLLPYIISVIMLRFALAIPANIGYEVFVTYIGLGLPATTPSLGNLVNAGRKLMLTPGLRYQLIYPTIVLSLVTISFYVVGNAFSDAADPKNHV